MIGSFFRMIGAWRKGRYREIPWKTIAFAVVLLLYLFSPIDIIPDYIPFFGVVDDAVLLGLFLRSLQKEVRRFTEWEGRQAPSGGPS